MKACCRVACVLALSVSALSQSTPSMVPQTVEFPSGKLRLKAYLWKPTGAGPFPAVLFNHGSGGAASDHTAGMPITQAANILAPFFVKHGYAFLYPFRRGHGPSASQAPFMQDLLRHEEDARGKEARRHLQFVLATTDQLDDVTAALAFLKTVPAIDSHRIALAGHSFGGQLTLLAAERDKTVRAAVTFAAAAGSWDRSAELRERLTNAIQNTNAAIMLTHAENDFGTTAGKALAGELERLHKPYVLKIYPPVGLAQEDGHGMLYENIPHGNLTYSRFWISMSRSNNDLLLREPALPSGRRRLSFGVCLLSLVLSLSAFVSGAALPPILANQNHASAGELRDGILTVRLEIGEGDWHPEAANGVALSVYAFGESGKPLQNPGPLIRVPQGTEIRASLHNALAIPVTIHGLGEHRGDSGAVVQIAPGAVQELRFTATKPGLFLYWGATEVDDLKLRNGVDAELSGAIVVDPPGASLKDEIFVLEMISDIPGAGARQTLATINGKSWPHTQKFQYAVGQEVHWRWVNASNEPHALHLHGSYYRVDAVNRDGRVETYQGDARPLVVTERIAQGDTFDMSWSPSRPGNWLFHCHMLQHMVPPVIPKLPGLSVTRSALENKGEHSAMSDTAGMGQLVLGITVPDSAERALQGSWHADRKLRLDISERGGAPRYAIQLSDSQTSSAPNKPGLIGPPIVLARNQPVEIAIVNRLREPTAIHWHGIELESYYDGVPGWSGAGTQITPPIAPGSSFVAHVVPPRAGTFIYHTHWHDASQLTNGLYGPLIVLPEGETFDPKSDLPFVFSIGDFGALQELALINGTPQSKTLQLEAGRKYRFRFINISTNNQAMQVSLRNPSGPVEWVKIAKDGADLPAQVSTSARETITVGETFDVKFSAPTAQDLVLDLLLPGQKIHTTQTLSFQAPTPLAR